MIGNGVKASNAITRDELLVEKAKLEDGLKEIVEQFQRVHASQKGAIAGVDRLLEVLDERAAKSEAPPQFVPLADGSVERRVDGVESQSA